MLKTLERYQKCSYGTLEVNRPNKDNEQSSYKEYLKLKGKYESLQRYQRHLLGEDLGPLNIDEIEHLEHQLDTSLKHIRSTRTQMMLDQLSDLQTKEKLWLEANKTLESKLEEFYVENNLQQPWGPGEQSGAYSQQHPDQTHGFFQPLECDSTLHIGFNPVATSSQITAATNAQNVNAVLPGWML
nr:developmental protein SEPALLATA 1-like [Ipomoea trifida]